MNVVIWPSAAADIARVSNFLAEKDERAAKRAAQVILNAAHSLAVLPERGKKSAVKGFRELVVPFGDSAYILRYAHNRRSRMIVVMRVWHGREERI